MKLISLALLSVSLFAQNADTRQIPDKLQADHALASVERIQLYVQHLLEVDKKLQAIEAQMKAACGGEIVGDKDGSIRCAPAPPKDK